MSIDGYIAGTSGEIDWVVWNWDDELKNYVREITEPVDCIVLGRKLAQGFIPHWASHPNEEGADKINKTKKSGFLRKHFTLRSASYRLEQYCFGNGRPS